MLRLSIAGPRERQKNFVPIAPPQVTETARSGFETGQSGKDARPHPLIYNVVVIALARACMTGMTWLFFVGVAGSLLVIVISFFEDLSELVGKE